MTRDPDGFSAQPFEQLAATYRNAGRDGDARHVMIARHRIRRKSLRWRSRGGLSKLGGWFLDITVGYGHRLWQAGVWLVALVAIGGLLFGEIYRVDHGGTGSVRGFDLYPSRDVKEVPPFLLTICGWLLTTALIAGLAARRM